MAKPIVIKCACGRLTNPVTISIVKDAWVKNCFAYFSFLCPQCKKSNTIKSEWNEGNK